MPNYSESPDKGEDYPRLLTDNDTGEVFRVVQIKDKGKPTETLVVAGLALTETSMAVSFASTRRRATKPKYVRAHPEVFAMMIDNPMTPNEQKVLGYLLKNMGYSNNVQVALGVIAEGVGIAKESACRALKSLRDRGVIAERTNKLIPGIPVYVIDPGLFFCGSDESRKGARAAFSRDIKKASDAKKPKLSVVK
jgi:hypothetical protein